MRKIELTNAAFEYLYIQRGDISHIEDRYDWHIAYEAALYAQFASIEAYLPKVPFCSALDIGGGMGGINILLNEHYNGDFTTTIVDGINDPCVMHRHAQTFNNARIAADFLSLNGVPGISVQSPEWDFNTSNKFDLVISFASFGFHYPPSVYLDRIARIITPQTVLIFDVRRDRDWERNFLEAFGPARIVAEGRKFQRMVFRGE